jgi:hypothetical protein
MPFSRETARSTSSAPAERRNSQPLLTQGTISDKRERPFLDGESLFNDGVVAVG